MTRLAIALALAFPLAALAGNSTAAGIGGVKSSPKAGGKGGPGRPGPGGSPNTRLDPGHDAGNLDDQHMACNAAFQSIKASGDWKGGIPPDPEAFSTACKKLPNATVKCLVSHYAEAHKLECSRVDLASAKAQLPGKRSPEQLRALAQERGYSWAQPGANDGAK